MIRVAAVGDIHVGEDCVGCVGLTEANECADVLLLAGDLTRVGAIGEAKVLAGELHDVEIPVVAVLGNHDYHQDQQNAIRDELTSAGATVLDGSACVLNVAGGTLGIAGTKGFGGGFTGASGSDFGEPEMKAFIRHTQSIAESLRNALDSLEADRRIVLLHYSPVPDTLQGERPEIYPFLGSYLLGEAIDSAGADLVLHGHAHRGTEKGFTQQGIRVRNVARPVIASPFNVYELDGSG
jgi:Icc-related predicted phosphoesterase